MKLLKLLSNSLNAIRIKWKWKTKPVMIIDPQKPVRYLLNDMTTPELVKDVLPPVPPPTPAFNVMRYGGGGFQRGTIEYTAAHCHVTISNVLNWLACIPNGKFKRWAASNNLIVNSHAGSDLNAFYDRRSMQFFYFCHPKIGGSVYTAECADIVAHELGHGLLDCFKPEMFDIANLEVWAFHEAFADMMAVFNALLHDEVINQVIAQTGGNLLKPNVVSNLAEHVGWALHQLTGQQNPTYLRSAINNFKYVHPGSLPEDAPDNQLAAECHSFGRVYLGVLYEILAAIYETEKRKGLSPLEALKKARDALAERMIIAVFNAPISTNYYEAFSKTLLWVEKTKFQNLYFNVMCDVFLRKNVMKSEVKVLSAPPCPAGQTILRMQSANVMRLSDHMIMTQSDNPLLDVKVEVPSESVYLYDLDSTPMDSILTDHDQLISSTQDALNFLHTTGSVGRFDKLFSVRSGVLRRNYFK